MCVCDICVRVFCLGLLNAILKGGGGGGRGCGGCRLAGTHTRTHTATHSLIHALPLSQTFTRFPLRTRSAFSGASASSGGRPRQSWTPMHPFIRTPTDPHAHTHTRTHTHTGTLTFTLSHFLSLCPTQTSTRFPLRTLSAFSGASARCGGRPRQSWPAQHWPHSLPRQQVWWRGLRACKRVCLWTCRGVCRWTYGGEGGV